jgi:cytosine/adenosine deaminase-related metal-dependent hydrolase
VATHVAESPAEVEFLERGAGAILAAYQAAELWKRQDFAPPKLSPVEFLSTTGILGPGTLAVHCVQVDEADIALLSESDTAVAHCPRSNARLECGHAPVAELLAAGVTVALGTDSLSSNESLDMFAEMRAALRVSEERASEAALRDSALPALTAASVLRMATLDGARALGWDNVIGSLEKGKRADVIAVRPRKTSRGLADYPEPWVASDLVERLVLNAATDDIVMVMIDGRTVFEAVSADQGRKRNSQSAGGVDLQALDDAFSAVRAKLGLGNG